jgi:hypothetical protein
VETTVALPQNIIMGHSAVGDRCVSVLAVSSQRAQWRRYTGAKVIRNSTKPLSTRSCASQSSDSAEELASEHESKIADIGSNQEVVDKVVSDAPETASRAMEDVIVPHAGEEFIAGLGLALEGWVAIGNKQQQKLSHFHCVRAPPMGVKDYLKRIRSYFKCSDECYVIALVIIDRVGKVDSSLTLCELNVHRLLVSAVMLAAKFHDDVYYSNAYYAKVGGLSVKEINQLESRLLKLLNWKVNVAAEEYHEYLRIVCEATRPRCVPEREK